MSPGTGWVARSMALTLPTTGSKVMCIQRTVRMEHSPMQLHTVDLLSTLDPGVGASEPESTTLCSRMQAALQRTPSNSDTAMLTSSTVPERDPIDRLTSGSLGTVGTPENLTGSSTAGRNSNASRRKPPPVQAGDGIAEAGPSGLSGATQETGKQGNEWVACTVAGSSAASRNSSASRREPICVRRRLSGQACALGPLSQ